MERAVLILPADGMILISCIKKLEQDSSEMIISPFNECSPLQTVCSNIKSVEVIVKQENSYFFKWVFGKGEKGSC